MHIRCPSSIEGVAVKSGGHPLVCINSLAMFFVERGAFHVGSMPQAFFMLGHISIRIINQSSSKTNFFLVYLATLILFSQCTVDAPNLGSLFQVGISTLLH